MVHQIGYSVVALAAVLLVCNHSRTGTLAFEAADRDPVLLRVSFENHQPGERYGVFDVNEDFLTLQSVGTFFPAARVTVVERRDGRGNAIAVRYPEGRLRSLNSGASWYVSNLGTHQELYLSYWVKFPPDFAFRAGGKLHGLCGGTCNTGGDKPNGHDGWSSRVHWGRDGKVKQYIYHKDQPGPYGHVFYWQRTKDSSDAKSFQTYKVRNDTLRFERGRWHHVETRVRVNDVGEANGEVQSWLDGESALSINGLEFRDARCSEDELLIDRMYFSTFFGGNSDSYRPVKDEVIYFDDFIVSTRFVPMAQSR